jgi:hypothetical protein
LARVERGPGAPRVRALGNSSDEEVGPDNLGEVAVAPLLRHALQRCHEGPPPAPIRASHACSTFPQ